MAWRLAPCLVTFRDQCDAAAPNRSTRSDGTKGDSAHSRRASDHNPDRDGSVNAIDITHDPSRGMNCHTLAAQLAASGDPRIDYVIFARRIWMRATGRWSGYGGQNPHNTHLHLSVRHDRRYEDDRSLWRLPMFGGTPAPAPTPPGAWTPPPVILPPPPVPTPRLTFAQRKARTMQLIKSSDGTVWFFNGVTRRWMHEDGPGSEVELYRLWLQRMGHPQPNVEQWPDLHIGRIPIDRDSDLPPGHPPLPALKHP